MIDAQEARKIADDHLKLETIKWNKDWDEYGKAHPTMTPHKHDDLVVFEKSILEGKFCWAFSAVTRTFAETGDPEAMLIGSPFFVVMRNDGAVHELTVGHPSLKKALAYYEAAFHGFDAERYDVIIHHVHRLPETLGFLEKLNLQYWERSVNPSYAHMMFPHLYKPEQLVEMLSALPCKFPSQAIRHHFRSFLEMDDTRDCTYELIGLSGEAARDPNHDYREKLKRKS